MASSAAAQILEDNGSISPLPQELRTGVISTSILGLLSFVSCGVLFIYISYKLWVTRSSRNDTTQTFTVSEQDDVSKLAPGANRKQSGSDLKPSSTHDSGPQSGEASKSKKRDSNSLLTLIHNLLLADMLQALSFLISLTWWRINGIFIYEWSCGAQAFFVVVGSVSISVFVMTISVNTFLIIVWGVKLSRFAVRVVVTLNWLFSFALAFVSLGVNVRTGGQLYGRSIALCWMRHEYAPTFGLWLQNFWLYFSIAITIVCYAWIFVALLRNKQSPRHMPPRARKNGPPELSGHHPAFLVYPAIYLATTVPISLVGILSASGSVRVSSQYFNLVSSISSLAGLLDAILWSTTILLSSSKELKEVGLDSFEFMRTPSRDYGNMVWVEGAARNHSEQRGTNRERHWWKLHHDMKSLPDVNRDRIMDDENMNGIHMDTITSVQVEQSSAEPWPTDSPSSKVPKAYHPTW